MSKLQLTKPERDLLKEFEKELSDLGVLVINFEKVTEKQIASIEKDFEKQKEDLKKLEIEIISFEEKHGEEIDSLAINSLLGE